MFPPKGYQDDRLPAPAALTLPLVRLCGCMFAAMAGFYLMLAAQPVHAAQLGGEMAAGLVTGLLMAATIVGEILAPRLIARHGRRQVMVAALMALAIPSLVGFSSSLAIVLLASIVRGFGLGFVLVAACAQAISLVPPSRRNEALGFYGFAAAAPAILFVPVGPWMLETAAASITAGIATLCGLCAILGVTSEGGERATPGTLQNTRLFPTMIWPATTLACGAVVVGVAITFLPLTHHGLGLAAISFALLLQGLAAAVTRWASGRATDRWGHLILTKAGLVLLIVGVLSLVGSSAGTVWCSMLLTGAAFGLLQNASLASMLTRATAEEADRVSAIWNIAYDAGLGAGSLVFAVFAASLGHSMAYVALTAAMSLLLAAAFVACERGGRPEFGKLPC